MTVENLHDAIGQIPSDLIAAVDEKRCRRPKRIPFRRYAALAASLALVLCGGYLCVRMYYLNLVVGSKETAMMQSASSSTKAPAAMEPEAAPEAPAAITGADVEEAPAEKETLSTYPAAAGEIPPEGMTEDAWEGYPEFPAEDVQYASTRNIGTGATTSDPVIRVLRSPAELQQFRERFGGRYTMDAFGACCEIYDEGWFEAHDLLLVLVKGITEDSSLSLASVTESDGDWCIRFYSGGPYSGERTDCFVLAALEKDLIPEGSHLFAMFEVP